MIHKQFEKLIPYVSENFITYRLWEEGKYFPFINIWQKAYRSSNSMTKAYAANNMAVAYEITGDLPKAIGLQKEALVYYGNSYFTDNTIFTKLSRYLEDLVLRNTEIEALKLQLGEK